MANARWHLIHRAHDMTVIQFAVKATISRKRDLRKIMGRPIKYVLTRQHSDTCGRMCGFAMIYLCYGELGMLHCVFEQEFSVLDDSFYLTRK